ncbi:hypothetical protein WJX74_002171 [Apatococcus lobatus]|uniref:Uncharacterized protein n=2 Tax=Apatococcus TaxID=904362 RepID=A0AAW1SK93_9CHLO
MSERFCRATLSENTPCAPARAAASLRNFIEQDPDIDSTTLGNLEAAAAALDELTGWTANSGDVDNRRRDTASTSAAGIAEKFDKQKKSRKDKSSSADPSALASLPADHGAGSATAPGGTMKKTKRHRNEIEPKSKKRSKTDGKKRLTPEEAQGVP